MDVQNSAFVLNENNQTGGSKPKLLEQVRNAIRTRHYSLSTENDRPATLAEEPKENTGQQDRSAQGRIR